MYPEVAGHEIEIRQQRPSSSTVRENRHLSNKKQRAGTAEPISKTGRWTTSGGSLGELESAYREREED